ncbi:MAG TPA: DinB family protein [Blastocatellia bacterium]|nr:DinB family protein [Blastocatellia bacterium]
MSEIRKIRSQIRRALEGEAWHGPSVKELLAGVTAEQAAAHPIAGAHSIWELALHIGAWEKIARLRIQGEGQNTPTDEEDWPPVRDTSEQAWKATIEELERGNKALREAVGVLDPAQLDDIIPVHNYSIYFLVHGVVQHTLYHAGQIALLKKALG